MAGVLGRITTERRTPKTIRADSGPELVPKMLNQRACRARVRAFIRGVSTGHLRRSLPGGSKAQAVGHFYEYFARIIHEGVGRAKQAAVDRYQGWVNVLEVAVVSQINRGPWIQ